MPSSSSIRTSTRFNVKASGSFASMGRVLKPAAGSNLAFFLPVFWLMIGDVAYCRLLVARVVDDDSLVSFEDANCEHQRSREISHNRSCSLLPK